MKTALKISILLFVLAYTGHINAFQNIEKKDDKDKQTQVRQVNLILEQDTVKKKALAFEQSLRTKRAPNVIIEDLNLRNENPRIAELNKEINKLVSLYKAGKGPEELKNLKEGLKSYKELSGNEKERIRRDAYNYARARRQIQQYNQDTEKYAEIYYATRIRRSSRNDEESKNARERTAEQIRKRLSELFDLREESKKEEIRKLQKQIDELEKKLRERQKNKKQIVDSRLKELIGEPSNLRW